MSTAAPSVHRALRACATVATVVLLAGGCSGESGKAAESKRLLTEHDVQSIAGLEAMTGREMADAALSPNPDPRGPCGATAPAIPLSGATSRAFVDIEVSLVEFVVKNGPEQAAFLTAMLADQHDGCPSYVSTTNDGKAQKISQIKFIPMNGIGDRGIAWTNLVQVGANAADGGLIAFETDGRLFLLQVQSALPLRAETMSALAAAAFARATN